MMEILSSLQANVHGTRECHAGHWGKSYQWSYLTLIPKSYEGLELHKAKL